MADGTITAPARNADKAIEIIEVTKTQRLALTKALGAIFGGKLCATATAGIDHEPECTCDCVGDTDSEVVDVKDKLSEELSGTELTALRDLDDALSRRRTV